MADILAIPKQDRGKPNSAIFLYIMCAKIISFILSCYKELYRYLLRVAYFTFLINNFGFVI